MDKIAKLLKDTKIIIAPEEVAIIGLGHEDRAAAAALASEDGVISYVSLPGELTLIVTAACWQKIRGSFPNALVEEGYRLITLQIVLPWDVVGYLARVTEALAEARISVGVISSHASDHLLIREDALPQALAVLKKLGCVFRCVQNGK